MKTTTKTFIAVFFPAFFLLQLSTQKASGQNVGINTTGAAPSASAGLDIDFNNKGLLIPRVALTSTTSASPVTTPATSLIVYNTATASGISPGFYFWDGTKWNKFSTGSGWQYYTSDGY